MIALISDIHGNFAALKKVLNEIDRLKITDIYCLGDIVGYYAQVNECCEALQERKVKSILGNHDWYMISNTTCQRSKSVNECLAYQRKILKKSNLKWLSTLPVFRKIEELSLVHGGWINPLDEYLNPNQKYFDSIPNLFFASGHTHKQQLKIFKNKVYCNPGSVGQPRDGNYKAAFATFNKTSFELYRVDYDVEEVCQSMRIAGFGEYFYNRLKTGSAHFVQ